MEGLLHNEHGDAVNPVVRTFDHAQVAVGTTRVRITATSTPINGIIIKAADANTDQVFVGNSDVTADNKTVAITAVSYSDPTVTLTVASGHNIQVDDSITTSGLAPAGYNGTFTVTAVSATTVEFSSAGLGAVTDQVGSIAFTAPTPTDGYELGASDSIDIPVNDLNKIYVVADAAAQAIFYLTY